MRLDIRKLINMPGAVSTFDYEEDFSTLDFGTARPAVRPVAVRGMVENLAGMLRLQMEVSTLLSCVCDRCGKPFDRPFAVSYETLLATELANGEDDEILLIEDYAVELTEIARELFVLNMDTKLLCSPDCKGLCPRCGTDLNLGSCRCDKEIDPRWNALAALLKENEQ